MIKRQRTDVIQMGEDLGHTPEETLRQIAEVTPRRTRQRRDVARAAKLANAHETGHDPSHRVPRVGAHAWSCRDCEWSV